MLTFNKQMSMAERRHLGKKRDMKKDLSLAMRQLEERKQAQRQREAEIDHLHKDGPPMMQEIDFNQKRLEEKTKEVNRMQGDGNYTLMLSQRKQQKRQKCEDLAEY